MKKSITNFISILLIGAAILIAGFSSEADGRSCSISSQTDFYSNEAGKHNSEFWSKFRESVMPDDKNHSDYTGNENPDPKQKQPNNN